MFALRRPCASSASVAAVASSGAALRFQSRRGGPPPPGGRAPPRQQQQMDPRMMDPRMMQQQQMDPRLMQQQQQQPPPPVPEEDAAPPPPPKKPEASQYVKVDENADGHFVLRLSRAPVNSLNLEFFTELANWFMWLSTEESGCKAVILTSDVPTVFSAGVDINELSNPQPERFEQFWFSFQEIWLILNSYPKPVIAAINGNSPAGGCILSLCCDYRVMARASLKDPANPKPYRIGLNESKLGIIAPPWVMKSLAYVIGERKAEKMLQLGETPTADEALGLGLVDKVVDEGDLAAAALQSAKQFTAISGEARWMSKDMMRRDLMQFFPTEQERQYDTQFFSQLVQNPEVKESVAKYLARLGGGATKK